MHRVLDSNDPHDVGLFEHTSGAGYLHLLREVLLHLPAASQADVGCHWALGSAVRGAARTRFGERSLDGLGAARELGVDRAAVSRLISGLQQLGLVSRLSDDRDGRRRPIVLTEDGSRLMVTFHAKAHEREAALTAALDPQSIEAAMRVLHTLRDTPLDVAPRRRR